MRASEIEMEMKGNTSRTVSDTDEQSDGFITPLPASSPSHEAQDTVTHGLSCAQASRYVLFYYRC